MIHQTCKGRQTKHQNDGRIAGSRRLQKHHKFYGEYRLLEEKEDNTFTNKILQHTESFRQLCRERTFCASLQNGGDLQGK